VIKEAEMNGKKGVLVEVEIPEIPFYAKGFIGGDIGEDLFKMAGGASDTK
jgi:hypothetical protein